LSDKNTLKLFPLSTKRLEIFLLREKVSLPQYGLEKEVSEYTSGREIVHTASMKCGPY
jgi:hypothetical protein